MKKHLISNLLCMAACTLPIAFAHADPDCSMAKHLAGHALSMIKGGASLEQTAGMFENNVTNKHIIQEIFSQKDHLANAADAGKVAVSICMKESVTES